eukprot:gene12327-25935_t
MIPAALTIFWGARPEPFENEDVFDENRRIENNIVNADNIPMTSSPFKPSGARMIPDDLVEAIASSTPYEVHSTYKSLEAAAMVLRIAKKYDERLSSPKMNTFYELLLALQRFRFPKSGFDDKKVIVLEGFSGSGKTTLAHSLTEISGARIIINIPDFILQVRDIFSLTPEPICRAFEHTINYFLAKEVTETPAKVVIIEQYYHSVCAHAACAVCGTIPELQELPISAFDWPLDLPKPTLVVFIFITTEIRMRRKRLGGGTSATERSSGRIVAYSLVEGPPTIAIDGSGSPVEVLELCLQACDSFQICLRNDTSTYTSTTSISTSNFNTSSSSDVSCDDKDHYNRRVSMGVYGVLNKLVW